MTDPCQRSAQPAPPLTESHASIVGGFTAFPNTRLDTVFAGWPVVVSVAPRPAAACGISLWEYGISMCRSPPVRPLRRCSLRRPSYTASRHCRVTSCDAPVPASAPPLPPPEPPTDFVEIVPSITGHGTSTRLL